MWRLNSYILYIKLDFACTLRHLWSITLALNKSTNIPTYKYIVSHLSTYPDLNFPLNLDPSGNLWWGQVYSFLKYPLKNKSTYRFIDTRTWNLFVLKHRERKKSLQGGFISDVKARNQLVHLYIYPRASNLKSYQHQNIKLIRYETY